MPRLLVRFSWLAKSAGGIDAIQRLSSVQRFSCTAGEAIEGQFDTHAIRVRALRQPIACDQSGALARA